MLGRLRGFVVLVVLVGVIGLVGFLFRDRLSGAAADLAVGDCFEVPSGTEVDDVQHQPCTDPHDGEVFLVADYPASSTYPTSVGFESWVVDNCLGDAFEAYVGMGYEQRSDIDVRWFSPTLEGWNKGDREMACVLTPTDGGKVTSSYRNSPAGS